MFSLGMDKALVTDPIPTTPVARPILNQILFVPAPPLNTANPISIAQANGYEEGASQAGVNGLIVGAGLGLLLGYLIGK